MSRKQVLCRNFQQGSCQYGTRCKFLHSTPQQQQPNPYGFGVKNQSQAQSGFGFAATNNLNKQKASDNKERGNRFSPLSGAGSFGSQQNTSQPQVATHVCTDPNICKQQIIEDFKNERPLWKLTCYSHWKYLPCDISGDTSYEELRAAAYDDSRRGLSLQQIVQREMCMFNSKVSEFENFLRSPYKRPPNSSSAEFNSSSSLFGISPQGGFQSNTPASVSGFGQFGSPGGGGFHTSTGFGAFANLSGSGIGNTSSVGNQIQNSLQSPFGKASGPSNNFPGLQSLPAQQMFNSTTIGSGPFASHGASYNTFGSPLSASNPNSENSVSPFSSSPFSSVTPNSMAISSFGNDRTGKAPNDEKIVGTLVGTTGQNFMNITSLERGGSISSTNLPNSEQFGQTETWLKETWTIGEIPEDEPPPYARR